MNATPAAPKSALRWCGAWLALCLICLGSVALAQPNDREQPMVIEADALRYDEALQTSVFTGNVVISQGTLQMRAQRAELRQDAQGNQFGLLQSSAPQRAFFRQQRPGLNEFIEGEALRIEYDSLAGTFKLIEQAVLRRYLGATLSDQTSGRLITYERASGRFTVEGSAGARTPENPAGRVRAFITPRPASAPAAPAPAPAPAAAPLQASPQLEPRR